MKHPKLTRPALCLLLALLTACASPSPEALRAGSVCRRPEAAASFWETDPEADHGLSDLRGADLRGLDLTDMEDVLFSADFDTRTRWPDALPEGFAFGFDADLFGRESRNAHFEVQDFRSRFVFQYAGDVARLADGRLRDVGDVHALQRGVEHGAVEWKPFHYSVCFCAYWYPARNAARFISTIS